MVKQDKTDGEMLKGTLDMMILRTLVTGDAHGHTIAKVIERTSEDVLEVEQGSLYPALHRLQDRGWVSSYSGPSENNRKAKFYRLTAAGGNSSCVRQVAGGGWPVRSASSWAKKSWQTEARDEMAQVLSPQSGGRRVTGGNRRLFGGGNCREHRAWNAARRSAPQGENKARQPTQRCVRTCGNKTQLHCWTHSVAT